MSLLKVGAVALMVVSGGLNPTNTLVAAEFDEFDEFEELEEDIQVAAGIKSEDTVNKKTDSPNDQKLGQVTEEDEVDPHDEFSSMSSSSNSHERVKVGQKKKRSANKKKAKVKKVQESNKDAVDELQPTKNSHDDVEPNLFYEYIALSGVAAYITNFFFGRGSNENRAKKWANRHAAKLRDYFYQVGPFNGEDLDVIAEAGDFCGVLFTKHSQNSFKLYATGNDDCVGLHVDLDLKSRQDLFSVLHSLLEPHDDILRLDVSLEDAKVDQFVLAVVPQRKVSNVVAEHTDIEMLARPIRKNRPNGLSDNLTVLSESVEAVRTLLTADVCAVLSKSDKWLRRLHISDQMAPGENETLSGRRMVMELALPGPNARKSQEAVDALVDVFLAMTKSMTKMKISAKGKDKIAQNRKTMKDAVKKDHIVREELAQQRQQAKADRQKELYNSWTPAQKRRWHEQDEKKRLKKEKKRKGMKMRTVFR